jgi:hypothetical protein
MEVTMMGMKTMSQKVSHFLSVKPRSNPNPVHIPIARGDAGDGPDPMSDEEE